MDKRTAKILFCCVASVLIVLCLFTLVYRLSQSSCELIHVEPQNLKASQSRAFYDAKSISSDDKSLTMRFVAYFELNKLKSDGEENAKDKDERDNISISNNQSLNRSASLVESRQHQSGSNQSTIPNFTVRNGQSISNPWDVTPTPNNISSTSIAILENPKQAKKRFLPLQLESIETRHSSDNPNRYKYILSFNCTKMNMVIYHHQGGAYVESLKLDVKSGNKKKTECDVQLPVSGAFVVGLISNNNNNQTTNTFPDHNKGEVREFSRFYWDEPLRYSCYNPGTINNPTKSLVSNLIGDLHINGIEFELKLNHPNKNERMNTKTVKN